MRAISSPNEISKLCEASRINGLKIGLVPTMGALHQGHLELVKKSKQENDITVVSIFINPLQFEREEDLKKYPRSIDDDLASLKQQGVDLVFNPSSEELYKEKPQVSISFGELEKVLEGAHRPGHFKGVGVVVSKLFNIIQPHQAYFGLKDLQQFLLIKRMVFDLDIPVELVGVDTVREPSGLALSSRNQRLSDAGKSKAANIYKGLTNAASDIKSGMHPIEVKSRISEFFKEVEGLELEYFEIVDGKTLNSISKDDELFELALCFAGYVEGVRLIDNLYLRLK